MKILLVSNGMPPSAFGGVETYTNDLARALTGAGHTVSIFCRESDFSQSDYSVHDGPEAGLRVIRVVNDYKQISSWRETFLDARIEQVFQTMLADLQPDVIHFQHLIALSARLPEIAAGQRIPFLTTLHDFWPLCQRVNLVDWRSALCEGPRQGGDCYTCTLGAAGQIHFSPAQATWLRIIKRLITPDSRRRLRRWLFPDQDVQQQPSALSGSRQVFEERYEVFRRSISLSDYILAPSAYVRERYIANGYPSRILTLPLGIDPPGPAEPASRGRPLTFGLIGSVIPIKGIDLLIQAFRAVRNPEIRLNIYGRTDISPVYLEQLKQLAAQDERIHFMGPFPPEQRGQVYQQIDLLVIPSVVPETFSLVAREALLHHKPVIASRLGALTEIIRDGVNGYLFSPSHPDELGRILTHIAENPQMLQSLELPGPFPIHTSAGHMQKLVELYSDLLAH